jgi:hypothetical protein
VRFRTLVAAVAVALLAALLGPVSPAHAAKPRLTYLFTSASSGIVAGNALWGQKSIQWTGYVSGRPKGSRLVTQTKAAGVWRTIVTTDKKVRRTVATGRFFPVLGAHRYRIALLSRTGRLLVASKAWTSTGYATVSLARVLTTLPPSIGSRSVTIGGYAYPMLWSLDHADLAHGTTESVAVGRCRFLRLATSVRYYGGSPSRATAWFEVSHGIEPTVISGNDMFAEATAQDAVTSVAQTVASVSLTRGVPGGYGLNPMAQSWMPGLLGRDNVTWTNGEALFGGVGLCSRVVR